MVDCKEYLKKFLELESNIVLGKPTSVLMHLVEEVPPPQDFVIFSIPPIDVSLLLSLDTVGIMYERVCSNIYVYVSSLMKSSSLPKKKKKNLSITH